jgi:hypothetical protein
MNTLIWKELRENARWLPVGLILVTIVAWIVAPRSVQHQSQITLGLLDYLSILLPLLALGLGIVQSVRDLQPAAGAYLRHRGVTSEQTFLAKLVAGFAIYTVAVTLPLLMMAGWIAMQGMRWTPMRPAQVIPPLVYALAAFLMHPAAMLMMARGASWWGSKWFPLLPVAAILLFFSIVLRTRTVIGSGPSALAIFIAMIAIAVIACRGWKHLPDDPPASQRERSPGRWLVPGYLALNSLVGTVGALVLGTIIVESLTRSTVETRVITSNQIVINRDTGEPWLVTHQQTLNENHEWDATVVSGDRIEDGKQVDPLKPLQQPPQFGHLAFLPLLTEPYWVNDRFFGNPWLLSGTPPELYWVFDYRGYLLGYRKSRWEHAVAADGIQPAGQFIGRPFSIDPVSAGYLAFSRLREAGYETPLLDTNGVYLLEDKPLAIRQIIDRPIDSATMLVREPGQTPRLIVKSKGKLSEYRLADSQGSEDWFDQPAEDAPAVHDRAIGKFQLTADLVQSVDLPPAIAAAKGLAVQVTKDGYVVVDGTYGSMYPSERLYQISGDGSYREITYSIVPGTLSRAAQEAAGLRWLGLFPPAFLLMITAIMLYLGETPSLQPPQLGVVIEHAPGTFAPFFIITAVVLIVSWIAVAFAARRRDLPRGKRLLWYVGVLPLGLATPLAIVAIYRRVYWESCPHCDKQRRIDHERCSHCGSPWESPQSEGIEITDRRSSMQESASLV